MIRITLCRDARLCVRCIKGYSVRALTGTDARPCVPTNRYTSWHPYQSLHVLPYYNGRPLARHSRASLQRVSRITRQVPPLELKSSKRGTILGTRMYKEFNTIQMIYENTPLYDDSWIKVLKVTPLLVPFDENGYICGASM